MNKKGILALKVLIELVLAIAGAILLSFFLTNIYSLIFPGVPIGPAAEGSATEIAKAAEQWRDLESNYLFTEFPFALEEERVIMGFGKQDEYILSAAGSEVKRPQEPECNGNTCLCVFKSIGIGDHDSKGTNKYLSTYNYQNDDKVIKCWEIKGVDQILSTKTWAIDKEGGFATRYYGSYEQRTLIKEDNLKSFKYSIFTVGGEGNIQGKINEFFHDVTYVNVILHGGPDNRGDAVMANEEGQLGPINMFLEKTTIEGVRTLFITPSTDITIPHRKTAGDSI